MNLLLSEQKLTLKVYSGNTVIQVALSIYTPVDGESDRTVELDTDINSVRYICIEYQC